MTVEIPEVAHFWVQQTKSVLEGSAFSTAYEDRSVLDMIHARIGAFEMRVMHTACSSTATRIDFLNEFPK